jgi:hypothetical protein
MRAAIASLVVVFAACGSTAPTKLTAPTDAGHVDSGTTTSPMDAHEGEPDTGRDVATTIDAGGGDAARMSQCTPSSQQNGTAVNTSYGRLDGTLVYVVLMGEGQQCNGDDSHVHLQVEVSGDIYDVAVDIGTAPSDEVGLYQDTITVPGGVWAEGWHGTDALAYPSLGLHSTSFPIEAPTTIGGTVASLLAGVSKISIFCKGYRQGNGCHDVHYENGHTDGALVLDPTSPTSSTLFFRFTSDSF